MSSDINLLLSKDEQEIKKLHRVKTLNFAAVMTLIGVGLISLFIFILIQAINFPSIKKEQDDVLRKISQLKNIEAKLFIRDNRINNIAEIFDKRKDLSKVTSAFLAKIPIRLFVESLEVDDKIVSMTASSTSLSSIGEFINNLTDMVRKKEMIKSLTINTLVFDETKNSYQVVVKSDLIL